MTLVNPEKQALNEKSILERLKYDPSTGSLTWVNKTHASGVPAGSIGKDGYIGVMVNRYRFTAHRICWFLHYGVWPSNAIDHLNGNRSDNSIANLRDVTHTSNQRNRATQRKHGVVGVVMTHGKYKARYHEPVTGKSIHLGMYTCKYQAAMAFAMHEAGEFDVTIHRGKAIDKIQARVDKHFE